MPRRWRDTRGPIARIAGWCLAAAGLLALALLPRAGAAEEAQKPPPPVLLAVADFSGPDLQTRRDIAEVLATDLAMSTRVSLVERSRLEAVLAELKLQGSGITDAAQAVSVGKQLGAGKLVMGSFVRLGGEVVLNARLVDVATGRVETGGAAQVGGKLQGDDADLIGLTHQLATQLHFTITGEWPPQRAETAPNGPDAEVFELIRKAGSDIKLEAKLDRGERPTYFWGDEICISFRVDRPCYVYLFNVNTSRKVKLLHPNAFHRESLETPLVWHAVPGPEEAYEFPIEGALGQEEIIAIASTQRLEQFSGKSDKGFIDFGSKGFIDFVSKDVGIRARTAPGTLSAQRLGFFTRRR